MSAHHSFINYGKTSDFLKQCTRNFLAVHGQCIQYFVTVLGHWVFLYCTEQWARTMVISVHNVLWVPALVVCYILDYLFFRCLLIRFLQYLSWRWVQWWSCCACYPGACCWSCSCCGSRGRWGSRYKRHGSQTGMRNRMGVGRGNESGDQHWAGGYRPR